MLSAVAPPRRSQSRTKWPLSESMRIFGHTVKFFFFFSHSPTPMRACAKTALQGIKDMYFTTHVVVGFVH